MEALARRARARRDPGLRLASDSAVNVAEPVRLGRTPALPGKGHRGARLFLGLTGRLSHRPPVTPALSDAVPGPGLSAPTDRSASRGWTWSGAGSTTQAEAGLGEGRGLGGRGHSGHVCPHGWPGAPPGDTAWRPRPPSLPSRPSGPAPEASRPREATCSPLRPAAPRAPPEPGRRRARGRRPLRSWGTPAPAPLPPQTLTYERRDADGQFVIGCTASSWTIYFRSTENYF